MEGYTVPCIISLFPDFLFHGVVDYLYALKIFFRYNYVRIDKYLLTVYF